MRTLLLSLLTLLAGCGPAFYQGRTADTCTEADVDTDTDGDTDVDSDTDSDTDTTDGCDGHDACLVFEADGLVSVAKIYGHMEIYEEWSDLEYAFDNASWATWSATETWHNLAEVRWGFDPYDLEGVRYNFSLCDGEEDDEWDQNHCTWYAYGATSAESRFIGWSELIFGDEDFDPDRITFCWDNDGNGSDEMCGTSALAGPGVDYL